MDPNKKYKIAGWASVNPGVTGPPIWDVVADYLRSKKVVRNVKLYQPNIVGMDGNPGMAG